MSFSSASAEANPVRPVGDACCLVHGVDGDGAENETDDIEAEEADNEVRLPVRVHDPMLPNRADIDQHNLTHVPFRSWCEHCVRGRGEGIRREKVRDNPEQMEARMDFCFTGDEGTDKKITILAVRERSTKMTMSTVRRARATTSSSGSGSWRS